MRSDGVTVRRLRIVIVLAVAGAVTVMLGIIGVIVGAGMRFNTRHPVGRTVTLGIDVAVAGIAFGLVV